MTDALTLTIHRWDCMRCRQGLTCGGPDEADVTRAAEVRGVIAGEAQGVELTEGEREELWASLRKCRVEDGSPAPLLGEGDRDHVLYHLRPAVERIIAARQAPTVALDVETVARALLTHMGCNLEGCTEWGSACPWCLAYFGPIAAAVVERDPRRTEAEVKAEALAEMRKEAARIRYIFASNRPCKPLEVVDVLDVMLDQLAERIGGE